MRHCFLRKRALGGAAVLAAIGLLLSGCGKSDPKGTVEGKVTLGGQAFSNARLNFINTKTGTAGAAEIQSDGTFKVETPLKPGTYTVFLGPKTEADPDHPSRSSGIDPKVPPACWSQTTSTIKIEVKEGKNEPTIELRK